MPTLFPAYSPALAGLLNDGSLTPVRSGSRLAPTILLVSRASCVFRRVALAARTRKALRAAALKAEQEHRFSAPRSMVIADPDSGRRAGVWTWETARDETRDRASADRLSGVATVPETLAREGHETGGRLVRCLEGVEGEFWAGGVLIASRWWPAAPSLPEWAIFVRSARGAGGEDSAHVEAVAPPLEDPRWRRGFPPLQLDRRSLAATASPIRVAAGVAAVGLALGAFDGARLGALSLQATALQSRLESGIEANARLAALRRSAQARNAQAAALASVGGEIALVDALTAAIGALPDEQLRLRRATFSTDELELEALVRKPVDGPALVARLEERPVILEAFVENADVDRFMIIRIKAKAPMAALAAGEG